MKFFRPAAIGMMLLVGVSACGTGQDRAALAKQAVQTYWSDINHMKLSQAYNMLTPGTQATRPKSNYMQDMAQYLAATGGITVTVGKPEVQDDRAAVPVKMHSPKAPGASFPVYQHLAWLNGKWLISDQNGGVSQTK